MGQDVAAGQKLQHVVPAGYWFGAYPEKGIASPRPVPPSNR